MTRLQQLQTNILPEDAYLLSSLGDLKYFTSFEFLVPGEREALLLVTKTSATLLHASFSPVNAPSEIVCIPGCYPSRLKSQVQEVVKSEKIKNIAIDKETLFVNELEELQTINELTISTLNQDNIWHLRAIKSADEITNIRKASEITQTAMTLVIEQLEPGITELEVEKLLEQHMGKLGSGPPAFPTIVAFGNHTALPHHQPTNLTLKDNMPILIDAGATFQGYCADMTRSFWFGDKPHTKFILLEEIIMEAYEAALKELTLSKTKKTAKQVDAAARSVIADEGYAQQFVHTTGHGLGLDIHEQPSISWVNEDIIKKNMTLTIEPGIYLDGLFGYRYENTILVGDEIVELTN